MAFEFIQIPANGQGSAKEELNKLLRNGRIASVRREFVSIGRDSVKERGYLAQVYSASPVGETPNTVILVPKDQKNSTTDGKDERR